VTIRDPAPQFLDWDSLSRNRPFIEFCPNHRSTISPSIAISPRRTTPSPLLQLEGLHPVLRLYNNSLLFRLVSSRLASGRHPSSLTPPPRQAPHTHDRDPAGNGYSHLATSLPLARCPLVTAARQTPHRSTTRRPPAVRKSAATILRRCPPLPRPHFAPSQGRSCLSAAAARTRRFQPSCNTNVLANQQGLLRGQDRYNHQKKPKTNKHKRPVGLEKRKDRNHTCPADNNKGG
jgi:hypothetical protein